MARQSGHLCITGTINNLCFYKMDGQYYVRMKSSLTGKRVKKDPAFSVTMRYAEFLASAARIASGIYRELATEQKIKGLYRKMTGETMRLLKENKTIIEVTCLIEAKYVKIKAASKKPALKNPLNKVFSFADAVLESIFTTPSEAARYMVSPIPEAAPT